MLNVLTNCQLPLRLLPKRFLVYLTLTPPHGICSWRSCLPTSPIPYSPPGYRNPSQHKNFFTLSNSLKSSKKIEGERRNTSSSSTKYSIYLKKGEGRHQKNMEVRNRKHRRDRKNDIDKGSGGKKKGDFVVERTR